MPNSAWIQSFDLFGDSRVRDHRGRGTSAAVPHRAQPTVAPRRSGNGHIAIRALRSLTALAALTIALSPARSTAQQAPPVDTTRAASTNRDPLAGDRERLNATAAQARAQQDQFERNHRSGLRFYNGGADAKCDVDFGGNLCYWNNNDDVPPPDERNDAKIERLELLQVLKRAQEADPSDDWVSGMRVRYAIEAGQLDTAALAASACRGTAWWCSALQGLAAHIANRHEASATAFSRALGQMPTAQKCEWTDLTWWLEPAMHATYKAIPCAGRDVENARILRLAQPLWLLPANDVSNELYARWTISRVHSLGRIPYDMSFGRNILESQVRYGWPEAWSIQNGGVADPRPPSVIGHEPTPSYDFMPTPTVIEKPLTATAADWNLRDPKARMRYSPRFGVGYGALPSQMARFRRGDSTLLAGGYRMVRELELGRGPYIAALTLEAFDGRPARQIRVDSAPAASALLLNMGTSPLLASLEVLAPAGRRAARVREAVQPLARDARLSDYLVLVRGDPSPAPSLERSAQTAYGSLEIEGGTAIGLYWEIYRQVSVGAPLSVSLKATRIGASFMQKLGSSIGLSKAVTPVSIRFADNGRADGGFGRSLTLNFPSVPNGEYQLSLVVSGGGVTDSTTRRIRVRSGR